MRFTGGSFRHLGVFDEDTQRDFEHVDNPPHGEAPYVREVVAVEDGDGLRRVSRPRIDDPELVATVIAATAEFRRGQADISPMERVLSWF